jgi:hypothetical protein
MKQPISLILPLSWEEVTISQLQEINNIDRENDFYDAELIAILSDQDPELIKRLDVPTYAKAVGAVVWTTKLPGEANYKPIIHIDGKEFGLVKLSTLSVGEWYSLENWLENFSDNMHKILALLYRPLVTALNDDTRILEPYDANTAEARSELFRAKGKVGEMYGALAFFLLTEKICIKTIQEYLAIQAVILNLKIPNFLKKRLMKSKLKKWQNGNGHGIPFFTTLLKATLRKYPTSQNSTSSSSSVTEPTKSKTQTA